MSMMSEQRDRLRKVASELQSVIDGLNKGHITYDGLMDTLNYGIQCLNGAADIIWQLRNDCVDLRMKNEKLRELVRKYGEYLDQDHCEGCVCKSRCNDGYIDECWQLTEIRELASKLEIEVVD